MTHLRTAECGFSEPWEAEPYATLRSVWGTEIGFHSSLIPRPFWACWCPVLRRQLLLLWSAQNFSRVWKSWHPGYSSGGDASHVWLMTVSSNKGQDASSIRSAGTVVSSQTIAPGLNASYLLRGVASTLSLILAFSSRDTFSENRLMTTSSGFRHQICHFKTFLDVSATSSSIR